MQLHAVKRGARTYTYLYTIQSHRTRNVHVRSCITIGYTVRVSCHAEHHYRLGIYDLLCVLKYVTYSVRNPYIRPFTVYTDSSGIALAAKRERDTNSGDISNSRRFERAEDARIAQSRNRRHSCEGCRD